MRIRSFAGSDKDAVVDLSLRAWAPVFASMEEALGTAIFQELYEDWRTEQARAVESALSSEDMEVWIADFKGNPVGFVAAQLHANRKMGEIHMIAVDPNYHRQGIGRALTDVALDWIKSTGVTIAMVETGGDSGHAPARRTYESAGLTLMPIARYFKRL